jgi:putative transposase
VQEIARKYGVSDKTVYLRRRKCNAVGPSDLKRLKDLERENGQLKELVADLSLDKGILQDALRRSSEACTQAGAALGGSRGLRDLQAQSVQAGDTSPLSLSVPGTRTRLTGRCGCG